MRLLIAIPALLAVTTAAHAAPFVVPEGHTAQLQFSGEVASAVVGLDEIAKPVVVSNRIVMITGKKAGTTNVVLFDKVGHVLFDGEVMVSAPTGQNVTIYRGSTATNYVCAPACQVAPQGGALADLMSAVQQATATAGAATAAQGSAPSAGAAPAAAGAAAPRAASLVR